MSAAALQAGAAALDAVDARLFRRVMGQFATGVTVITWLADGQPAAMTANAFVFFSISKSPYPVYLRAQVKYEIPVAFLHASPVRGSCMYSSPPT